MNQPYRPDPYGQQYEVSYPPPPGYGGPPPSVHGSWPAPQQQPAHSRSKLPILVAAGVALLLVIGLTLFFVLRDSSATAGGGAPGKAGPKSVVKSFFVAVDKLDEGDLKKYARGDLEDDLDDIMDGGAQQSGVEFANGTASDLATKKTDGLHLAVVLWSLDDVPDYVDSDDFALVVALLDEGDGFQICKIESLEGGTESAADLLEEFEYDYESTCDYNG